MIKDGFDYSQKELAELYFPLSKAKEEIWKRWENKELRKKVTEFLKSDIPPVFANSPKAVLCRNIASPDFELIQFAELTKLIKLDPVCFEYLNDKFTTENLDKYHLGKMYFYKGTGKKMGDRISCLKIIDFDKAEGQRIKNINTSWNENFIKFHHRILQEFLSKEKTIKVVDASDWVISKKEDLKNFYVCYFSLFICFGVLFENFLLNKRENKFTREIVLPSFKEAERIFGVKPLIVPIASFEDAIEDYWWYYPEKVEKLVKIADYKEENFSSALLSKIKKAFALK